MPGSEINLIAYDQIHCHPLLVYNAGLQCADPAWPKCIIPVFDGNFSGVFDTPRTLGPAAGLFPVPTSSLSSTASVGIATPAPSAL